MRTTITGFLFCCFALTPWLSAQDQIREVVTVKENVGGVVCVAFSGDGKTLAFNGLNSTVRVWDVENRKDKALLTGFKTIEGWTGTSYSFVLNHDGSMVATAGEDAVIKLWNVNTSTVKATLIGHSRSVGSLALTADDSLLASVAANDSTVVLWDLATGKQKAQLKADARDPTSLAFSPNGKLLAAASSAGAKTKVGALNIYGKWPLAKR